MFWIIVMVIVLFLFIKFRKNKQVRQSDSERDTVSLDSALPTEPISDTPTIQVSMRSYEVETMIAENEDVSMIDLGRRSESGGYINWSIYRVIGTNSATNRKNTRQYEAKDREHAVKLAESDGLIGPFEITPIPYPVEPDKIRYYTAQLNSYGILSPVNAVKEDLRAILDRVRYSNDIVSEKEGADGIVYRRVRPVPSPSKEFAEYADNLGIKFSMYISSTELFHHTIQNLEPREKIAFYAYCLICAHNKQKIGNLQKSQYVSELYKFSDSSLNDPALLKSIIGRDSNDYLHPHKGSKAYKAVAEYFAI